jgi:DNA topoisomerase-1
MYINVPRRYNFDDLTQAEMNELIEAKREKEANRYIQRWEDEKISVENARWGPVIKFGKKVIYLPKKADGTRATTDEAAALTLEQVKVLIEAEVPGAFAKKTKPAAKKAPSRKTAKKKSS